MSPSCDVAVLAVGDGLVSSNSRSEPLSMVVVSGRRLLRSCTLVRLVALAGPAGLVGRDYRRGPEAGWTGGGTEKAEWDPWQQRYGATRDLVEPGGSTGQ